MPGRMFFYTDENGVQRDAEILNEALDNAEAEMFTTLQAIRQHIDGGGTLEDALGLFAPVEMRQAYANGEFTLEDIDEALDELSEETE